MSGEDSYLLNSVPTDSSPGRHEDADIVERTLRVFHRIARNVKHATVCDLISIAVAVLLTLGGISGQTLVLNFWLEQSLWAQGGGPFTVLTSVASFTAIVFNFILLSLVCRGRHGASFMLRPKAVGLTALLGFFNAANGVTLVYATQNTPEQFQAILFSLQVIFTFIGMCIFVPTSTRRFSSLISQINTLVLILSFALCIGGIFVGLLPQFSSQSGGFSTLQKQWTLVFAAGMVPGALYNVVASYYLKNYTIAPETDLEETVQSDANFVKFAMLAFSAVFQLLFIFVFFPVDWNTFYGNPPYTAAGSRLALSQGWQCVFDSTLCPGNAKFFVGFLAAYIAQYLGCAVLNRYSSTLASMVTQVASPVTTAMLLIFPPLRVGPPVPLKTGPTVAAIIMLTVGAVLYFLWEESVKQDDDDLGLTGPTGGRSNNNSITVADEDSLASKTSGKKMMP